ncbi:MAG: hypothetical protein PHW10_05250 [Candidatus Peribacteraceae bacterium]|nr:hypothetical protein [Candidatus Peribacteraceae bacterium]
MAKTILDDHVRRQLSGETPPEETTAGAKEVQRRIDDIIKETGRAMEAKDMKTVEANAEAVSGAVTETRQAVRETLHREKEGMRSVADAEQALLDWAGEDLASGDEQLRDPLQQFHETRLETRREENQPITALADALVAVQGGLLETMRQGRMPQMKDLPAHVAKYGLIEKIERAAAMAGYSPERDDIEAYLFADDRAARERLASGLEGLDGRRVLSFIDDAHAILQRSTGGTPSFLRLSVTRAAMPTKADLPRLGWLKALTEDKKYRNTRVDLATDTGTTAHLYIDRDGNINVLEAQLPSGYDGVPPQEALAQEQVLEELRRPTAAPLYAHLYTDEDIRRALDALPSDGTAATFRVLTDGKETEVMLRREEGKPVYVDPPAGVPEPEDLRRNPGRYIEPYSLAIRTAEGT